MELEHIEQEQRARKVVARRRAVRRAARRTFPPFIAILVIGSGVWFGWYDQTAAAMVLAALAYYAAHNVRCDATEKEERIAIVLAEIDRKREVKP